MRLRKARRPRKQDVEALEVVRLDLIPSSRLPLRAVSIVWKKAQREELAFWRQSATSLGAVLSELADIGTLVDFGCPHLPIADSAIELGIGPLGIGWAALAGIEGRPVGVDSLPRLEPVTGNSHFDRFLRSVQASTDYLQADATQRLPYDDCSFPIVVCDNVLDHTQEPFGLLSEARRLVTEDGRLLLGVNVFSSAGLVKWRLHRRFRPDDFNVVCHPHSWSESRMLRLLGATGWQTIVVGASSRRTQLIGHSHRLRLVAAPA
jgi:SAM-dependent methyltransferase